MRLIPTGGGAFRMCEGTGGWGNQWVQVHSPGRGRQKIRLKVGGAQAQASPKYALPSGVWSPSLPTPCYFLTTRTLIVFSRPY